MVFNADILTTANTLQSKPLRTPMIVFKGLIYHVEIYLPPGASGLVGVRLEAANRSLYPYDIDGWFRGDDIVFKYDDLTYFDIPTQQIDIVTYNIDTVYNHSVIINIGMVTDPMLIETLAPSTSFGDVITAIDKLTAALTANLPSGTKPTSKILGTG